MTQTQVMGHLAEKIGISKKDAKLTLDELNKLVVRELKKEGSIRLAGLGIFRYETTCGTVYGHTGNTAGYTQFIAATPDGSRSVTVAVSAQITPKSDAEEFARLRNLYRLGVCAATAR